MIIPASPTICSSSTESNVRTRWAICFGSGPADQCEEADEVMEIDASRRDQAAVLSLEYLEAERVA
jgi:hypothetical protein